MKMNRRDFVKGMGMAGSAFMFFGCAATAQKKKFSANDKVNVAMIGMGGRGIFVSSVLSKPESGCQVVATCDVDEVTAAKGMKYFPKDIPFFRDYRVMFDKMGSQIDAVVISTPDHTHYPIALWAMVNGKHVFLEKPLTRTVWESRELQKAAKKYGIITQMGNHGHTTEGWRCLKEWTDGGIIGTPTDVFCWTNRPFWPQGGITPLEAMPIPSTLDYDSWLNVAPHEPYNARILPFKWRGLRNYGTGAAGDMACHFLDIPYAGLDLGMPTSVKCTFAEKMNDYTWPSKARVEMVFPAKGNRGEVKLHWCDGNLRPEQEIRNVPREMVMSDETDLHRNAIYIQGTKETVQSALYGEPILVYPRTRMVELKKANALPEKTIARSKTPFMPHYEWIDHIRQDKQPPSSFDYSAPFTEMCLLMMVAVAAGKDIDLQYDAETMSFKNYPEANKYLRSMYDYRKEFLPL